MATGNTVLAAFREYVAESCPEEEEQTRMLNTRLAAWQETFAKRYAEQEVVADPAEAEDWILCLVDVIMTIDGMLNSSHASRRGSKTWAQTIKSCRGYAIPGPGHSAADGYVFSMTDACFVKWSGRTANATTSQRGSSWSADRSSLELAHYFGGLYDEIALKPVFTYPEYPGPVIAGTVGVTQSGARDGMEFVPHPMLHLPHESILCRLRPTADDQLLALPSEEGSAVYGWLNLSPSIVAMRLCRRELCAATLPAGRFIIEYVGIIGTRKTLQRGASDLVQMASFNLRQWSREEMAAATYELVILQAGWLVSHHHSPEKRLQESSIAETAIIIATCATKSGTPLVAAFGLNGMGWSIAHSHFGLLGDGHNEIGDFIIGLVLRSDAGTSFCTSERNLEVPERSEGLRRLLRRMVVA